MADFVERVFGPIAVALGYVTPEQVKAALRAQAARSGAAASPPPLGLVLVEQGVLTPAQAEDVLRRQRDLFGAPVDVACSAAAGRRFGQLAVALRLAAPEVVDRALNLQVTRAATGQVQHLAEILLELGVLDADGVVRVLDTQAAAPTDTATVAATVAPGAPGPASVAAEGCAPPPVPAPGRRCFGKYELVQELGRGGMGVVYQAWHPELKAHFAVKVLLAGPAAGPEDEARFAREAQATARLRHPGIISVHDVGVAEGRPYLVMDFVEGVSLFDLLKDPARAGLAAPSGPGAPTRGLAVRDAARIALEVADAIEHAHRQGVVHRDLKPGNVLVDRAGRAHVLDFGLAKLLDRGGGTAGPALSRTGMVLGTLAYMAPEQAAGEVHRMDERTDVYALGVLLYEMTTGRRPFEGASDVELLGKILTAEPAPPRRLNPSLPADLETIILKALEREPGRRYFGAAALASELRRFLDGRAVAARPPSPAYRSLLWVRRRRGLVATCAALLLAGGATVLLSWRASTAERQRLFLRAQLLADLRQKAGRFVEIALEFRRAGLPRRPEDADHLARLRQAVQEAVREDPAAPEPYYHLGRMYRALLRFADARQAQEEALARDANYGPSRYERGVLLAMEARWLGESRRSELLRLRASAGERERTVPAVPSAVEVEAAYPEVADLKRRALADLTRAADLGETQPEMKARARAARGLVAGLQGSATSERLLSEALKQDVRLEEVHAALAECAAARGDWEEAARRYEDGWKADLGYVPHVVGLGWSLGQAADAVEGRGGDGGELRLRARRALEAALGRDPRQPELWEVLATFWAREGEALEARGKDPSAEYQEALTALDKALALNPNYAEAASDQACVYRSLGDAKRARGADAAGDYQKALAGFDRALAINPNYVWAASSQANVYQSMGDAKRARGADPSDEYRKALAGYDRALALDPNNAYAANSEACAYQLLGYAKHARGVDPSDEYRKALAGYDRALAINPNFAAAASNQACVYQSLGDVARARGADPSDEYRRALAGYDRALAINPNSTAAASNQGALYKQLGDAKRAHGADPSGEYHKALALYERALAINPNSAEAASSQASVYRSMGDAKRARGADPTDDYQNALAGFDRALALNPSYVGAANNQALVHHLLGDAKRARGADPSEEYRKALAGYDRALAINPNTFEAASNQANVYRSMGDAKLARGADPSDEYGQALAGYDRALRINPNFADAVYNRASVCMQLGHAKRARGADPSEEYRWALAGYDRVLAINPNFAAAVCDRAIVYHSLGDAKRARGADPTDEYREALAGYDRNLRINPQGWESHTNRGLVLESLGDPAAAIRAYEAALAINGAAASTVGPLLARARAAASAVPPGPKPPGAPPAWLALVARATQAGIAGDYAAARPLYEASLAAAATSASDLAAAASDPATRAALLNAHYNLACILALASAGRDGPQAAGCALPPLDAARLCDTAFEQLAQAIELGYRDREHITIDPDLEPLRADPRWGQFLESFGTRSPK